MLSKLIKRSFCLSETWHIVSAVLSSKQKYTQLSLVKESRICFDRL